MLYIPIKHVPTNYFIHSDETDCEGINLLDCKGKPTKPQVTCTYNKNITSVERVPLLEASSALPGGVSTSNS